MSKSKYSSERSLSLVVSPKQVAFMKIAPPTVPGSPENSLNEGIRFALQKLQTWLQSAPADNWISPSPERKTRFSWLSFLVESIGKLISSGRITLLPPPRTKNFCPLPFSSSIAAKRLSVSNGSMKKGAAPPTRIVVRLDIGSFFFMIPLKFAGLCSNMKKIIP